ncbi:MAG: iron-sulfur cluster assembly protein [bacterium]
MNEKQEELKEKVINVIKKVYDPELPVNIYELGLIYDIKITEQNEVVVLMTLTAPNCPEAESIPAQVEYNIRHLHDVKDAKVLLTFDPPWDRDKLSDVAKIELGLF